MHFYQGPKKKIGIDTLGSSISSAMKRIQIQKQEHSILAIHGNIHQMLTILPIVNKRRCHVLNKDFPALQEKMP